jgi:hypothetical protein
MAQELSVEEAVRLKSSGLGRWLESPGRVADTAIIERPCPKCGGRVVCAYADIGSPDFYDTFAHVCLTAECAYCEEKSQHNSNMGGGGTIAMSSLACFYCGRPVW